MTLLITDAERNAAADHAASRIGAFSLHITTPGLTGAAEAANGTPAYARKVPTFSPAGVAGPLGPELQPPTVGVAWTDTMTFDVPAGDYTYWGAWSDVTGGTFRQGNVLSTAQHPSAQTQINFSVGIGPFVGA